MNDDMFEQLGAYYDGELSDHEQEEMQRLVASNPEYQQTLQQFKLVSDGINRLPKYRVPDGINLTDKILAAAGSRGNAAMGRKWSLDSALFPVEDEESEPISGEAARTLRSDATGVSSESSDTYFPSETSWRARISRALLWPTMVLGLALGFWFCNNPQTSTPVVLINNSSSEE